MVNGTTLYFKTLILLNFLSKVRNYVLTNLLKLFCSTLDMVYV